MHLYVRIAHAIEVRTYNKKHTTHNRQTSGTADSMWIPWASLQAVSGCGPSGAGRPDFNTGRPESETGWPGIDTPLSTLYIADSLICVASLSPTYQTTRTAVSPPPLPSTPPITPPPPRPTLRSMASKVKEKLCFQETLNNSASLSLPVPPSAS